MTSQKDVILNFFSTQLSTQLVRPSEEPSVTPVQIFLKKNVNADRKEILLIFKLARFYRTRV